MGSLPETYNNPGFFRACACAEMSIFLSHSLFFSFNFLFYSNFSCPLYRLSLHGLAIVAG